MDKFDHKKQILSFITHFFNKDEKKAEEWYSKPHSFISDNGDSPRQMVDDGKGLEVLKWIKMVLNK